MTEEPLRIGVIGLGWVGQARHLPTIRAEKKLTLVGVADRHADRVQAVRQRIPNVRAAAASRLSDIEWIDEVDAISIATAPMAHHDLVCEGLERGLHVITEKPFAMTVSEGQAMVAVADRVERQLGVVHNFQFARSMQKLRSELASGKLGKIRGVRAIQMGNPSRRLPTWYENLPFGLFYDESPHLLYLLASIAGQLELTKAVVVESRHGNTTPSQIDAWFRATTADYPISLSCNFESGVSEWYLIIHGDNGVGVVDVFRDIYIRLPNDGAHGTCAVLGTSIAATWQHWLQHIISGVPHLTGRLSYGNDSVFRRFADAAKGDASAFEPIEANSALRILTLQHNIISQAERLSA